MAATLPASRYQDKRNDMQRTDPMSRPPAPSRSAPWADTVFSVLAHAAALLTLALLVGILGSLVIGAAPAIREYGLGFLWHREWDPVQNRYGGLVMIYGTLMTSLIALLIAVPVSFGIAPNFSFTGSHSADHKKPRPKCLIAGPAPTNSDTMMPAISANVSQAAPCANTENKASPQGATRRRCGAPGDTRAGADEGANGPTDMLAATGESPGFLARAGTGSTARGHHLLAMILPAASLMLPAQCLRTNSFTVAGSAT